MPRVTVGQDKAASAIALPSAPDPMPDLDGPPEVPAVQTQVEETPPPEPARETVVVRQIKTVLIEVPLCDNPPGLDGTPSFTKAHVNLQLIKSRSPTGRHLLHRLWWGLKETGAKLGNGRKVANRNDAVVWRIEQLEERA